MQVLMRAMSSPNGAAGSSDQVGAYQNPKNQGCKPFYVGREPQEHRGQRSQQGPTLLFANRIYFLWCGSKRSAASAPTVDKPGWTWCASRHAATTEGEEGGGGGSATSLRGHYLKKKKERKSTRTTND